jgi:hypothetical protein
MTAIMTQIAAIDFFPYVAGHESPCPLIKPGRRKHDAVAVI